ncbi:MAG: M48 family metallopeptidase [Halosimplex sp.]
MGRRTEHRIVDRVAHVQTRPPGRTPRGLSTDRRGTGVRARRLAGGLLRDGDAAGGRHRALAGFGLEYAVSGVVTDGLFRGVEWADEAPPRLRRIAEETAADLGTEVPSVVVDREAPGGVNVLGDEDRAVLIVSASLADGLDDGALRAVVAHELAHLSLGHLRRGPLREAVTHVVGLAVFWLVALRYVPAELAVFAGGLFLVAGVARSNPGNALYYAVASAGVAVLLRAVAARASRLEECHADDVAVARTSAADFCTGLYAVGAAGEEAAGAAGEDAVAGSAPFGARRTRFERLTAVHPSIERRLARHGFVPEDVAERAGAGPVEGGPAADG